jgi:FeS assembly SUF system regulator
MLRLNKLTDYALLVTNCLVQQQDDERCSMADIAVKTGLSLATVRKILKKLVDGGVVQSYRGVQGGYRLVDSPERISVVRVISALEGPFAITECNREQGCCSIEQSCQLRDNWHQINGRLAQMLESIHLSDLAAPVKKYHTV